MTWLFFAPPARPALFPLKAGLILVLAVLVVFAVAGLLLERRRRRDVRQKFRQSRGDFAHSGQEGRRSFRRVLPPGEQVWITLTEPDRLGQRAKVIDLSQSGMAIEPDFPLKLLPPGTELANVLVETPAGALVIRRARTVRLEHEIRHRRLALRIEAIDADQQSLLDRFLNGLPE